jgi:hypothetical protein
MTKPIINDRNFKLLMSIVFKYFVEKYNYEVGEDEEVFMLEIMKHYTQEETFNRNKFNNYGEYIKHINKLCLNHVIKAVEKRLEEEQKETPQVIDIKPDEESSNSMVRAFEQQNQMRMDELKQQKPTEINFGQNIEYDNKQVLDNMKKLEQERNAFEQEIKPEEEKVDKNEPAFVNKAPKAMGETLLIQKPKEFEKLVDETYKYNNNFLKTYHLVIDSRDRNTDSYPNNYNYQIDLDRTYTDIVSVELVSANIPKTEYLINSSNNLLHFNDDGTDYIATIEEGNYTISELTTAIKTAMDATGTSTFTVSSSSTTNKITILSSGSTFSLLFNGGSETYNETTRTKYPESSIAPIIGFSKADTSGALTYTGDNQYNLNGPTYILLDITEFQNLNGVNNKTISNSFAKIMLDTEQSGYKYFKSQSDYIAKKEFSPLLAKLAQMNIKFKNYDDSFYDFGNLPHSLYFKITTLNQNQGYFY